MDDARPILVTGSHRSGTGWIGRMIAACRRPPVAYLWEPFSLLHRPGTFAVRFPYWFPYVSTANEEPYLGPMRDLLSYRYRISAELTAVRSLKDAARMPRDWLTFARYRRIRARPLLKDPIAVFSAGWLADRFSMDVVVLIRHPAAFADSLVRRGWRHPFDHFLRQPLLVSEVLSPFEEQIRKFATAEQPLLDQACLLWNLVHHAIAQYRASRPGWLFLRLEDVAQDPEVAFARIYGHLHLSFDDAVRRTIREHSAPSNPVETADPSVVRRNSRAAAVAWRSRLDASEVERIRTLTHPLASAFYSDEDW